MKFEMTGGRAGLIKFEYGELKGQLDWEGLVRDSAIVIFSDGCKTHGQFSRLLSREELLSISQAFCDEKKWQIEVQFENGIEVLKPRNS